MKVSLKFNPFPVLVVYTDKMPSWAGGLSFGPLILMRPKYAGDVGLHKHELLHSLHWYGFLLAGALAYLLTSVTLFLALGVGLYGVLYKLVPAFRQKIEVLCYTEQIAHYPPERNVLWAAIALATHYDLDLSVDEARKLMDINPDGFYRP